MLANLPLTQKMMLLSIVAALLTIALKFLAWGLTGSVGLFSDAAESVVNVFAATFALFALRVAAQPPDDNHAYGHEKAEYFSSALEGLLIMVAAGAIMYAAVNRLFNPAPVESLGIGLALSLFASAINGGVAWLLFKVAKQEDSIVLEADAHHLLTDVWTSVGVVLGLVLVMLIPSAGWLDPVIAIIVALNILRTAWELIRRSMDGLMDIAWPENELAELETAIKQALQKYPNAQVGRLRTRKSGSRRFVSFILWVPDELTVVAAHKVCDDLEAELEATFNNTDVDIHMEPLSLLKPEWVSIKTAL